MKPTPILPPPDSPPADVVVAALSPQPESPAARSSGATQSAARRARFREVVVMRRFPLIRRQVTRRRVSARREGGRGGGGFAEKAFDLRAIFQFDGADCQRRSDRRDKSSEPFIRQVVDFDRRRSASRLGLQQPRAWRIKFEEGEEAVFSRRATRANEASAKLSQRRVQRLVPQV